MYLLIPHQQGHPITYNHYFTETVQELKERSRAELTRIIQNIFGVEALLPSNHSSYVEMPRDYRPLLEALMKHYNPDMNQYACSEALDRMQAYYQVSYSL
jgi:hypothetical protein